MSISTIADCLQRSVSGDPWHGSSLQQLLADVTPDEAASHPIAAAHSISEIVAHAAVWIGEVAAWLGGAPRTITTPERDWPVPSAWPQPFEQLKAANARLQQALSAFPESGLSAMVGGDRDPASGTGLSFEAMLVGIAEHNAYHGGQIGILKRALRGKGA